MLRLIINMTPFNNCQRYVDLDLKTWPQFSQLGGIELFCDEQPCWTSKDLRCAFYLFELPSVWAPYFVLSRPCRERSGCRWAALRVIPMGWCNAVAFVQYVVRRALTQPPPMGAGLPVAAEIRRDPPLPIVRDGHIKRFW